MVGSSGPSVGDRISMALQPGGEMYTQLHDLAKQLPETQMLLHPQRAHVSGFLKPLVSNPYGGLPGIVHRAPSYGLAGNSKDDVALDTGRELDAAHDPSGRSKLSGMTLQARTKYVR